MGFVERLREFVGREARLEKVPVSKLGARNTYLLEFTPGYSMGEAVILRDVWAGGVLVEYVATKRMREISLDRIQLGSIR